MLPEIDEEFGDLRNRRIDIETKKRLVQVSYQSTSSVGKAARKAHLKPATVKKYRWMISKDYPMYETHGRPPKLDQISINDLIQKIMSLECCDRATLQREIRQEAKKTHIRRYHLCIKDRVINIKTVGQWRCRIIQLAEQFALENNRNNFENIRNFL